MMDVVNELLQDGNRVVRPKDAARFYLNPSKEMARLGDSGVLLRLGRGYFAVVPRQFQSVGWRPTIEGIALGIAIADYGHQGAVLMGISAARVLGIAPRAVTVGVVATDHQRPAKNLELGSVTFVKRRTKDLDAQLVETDLVRGLATAAEQTAIDIAARPELGGISPATATETLTSLAQTVSWDISVELAGQQRMNAALARFAWVASAVVDPPSVPRPRNPVSAMGLRPIGARPGAEYGVDS